MGKKSFFQRKTHLGRRRQLVGRLLLIASLCCGGSDWAHAAAPRLRVSENKHYLVDESGAPFFWLGDTAWELFHELTREEAAYYLRRRKEQGFTVIQAVLLSEFDGVRTPNAQGDKPLVDEDPSKPNEAYFQHVDWIVHEANSLGLIMALLPTWSDKVGKTHGAGPQIFTPANAAIYGEYLGKRYKDAGVVWVMGGDRTVDDDEKRAIWRALGEGLRKGGGGAHLVSFHPNGGHGSAEYFPNAEATLDFNMRQDGHGSDSATAGKILADYLAAPPKPVLDAEPLYEDHPIAFKAAQFGYSNAADVRRFLYWDLFSGACGHTYGNHAVWQFYDPKRGPGINGPLMPWKEAVEEPGAREMRYARELMESRPVLSRVPDNALIVAGPVPAAIPGAGTKLMTGTRAADGSYAMIYCPASRPFEANLKPLSGTEIHAWWFNPRDGSVIDLGQFAKADVKLFSPPDTGENLDWVLVLDDASRGYARPGTKP